MRTWPALDVGLLKPAPTTEDATSRNGGSGFSRPDLLQAALLDYDVAAIDDNAPNLARLLSHARERDRAHCGAGVGLPRAVLRAARRGRRRLGGALAGRPARRPGRRIIVAPPWDVPDAGRLKPAPADVGATPSDVGAGFSRPTISSSSRRWASAPATMPRRGCVSPRCSRSTSRTARARRRHRLRRAGDCRQPARRRTGGGHRR